MNTSDLLDRYGLVEASADDSRFGAALGQMLADPSLRCLDLKADRGGPYSLVKRVSADSIKGYHAQVVEQAFRNKARSYAKRAMRDPSVKAITFQVIARFEIGERPVVLVTFDEHV